FELVDIPLIEYAAGKGKPIILSTGMATIPEIEEAIDTAQKTGNTRLALLKCSSTYPALPEEIDLNTIPYLKERFNLPIGLSDHTTGITTSIAAVALGACIIEKHLTLSRDNPSPDSAFSLEPVEFKEMVQKIRTTRRTTAEINRNITISERETENRRFRRSLFCVKDIKKGELFTKENTRCIRPAYGLHPRYLKDILCKQAACDIQRGIPIDWNMLSNGDKIK
ncbi:MAG: N-acetylneuraminate synthase family protein, partial [Dehalococcoidales bacterium]|nr:N-acetylneuraminate synthase family protein [Dehalococcoidales bacterium]